MLVNTYSFNLPGPLVWTFHICYGMFLAYIGYKLLNKEPITQFSVLTLIITGVLAILYHSHLFYLHEFH